jgi:hypothetical protein
VKRDLHEIDVAPPDGDHGRERGERDEAHAPGQHTETEHAGRRREHPQDLRESRGSRAPTEASPRITPKIVVAERAEPARERAHASRGRRAVWRVNAATAAAVGCRARGPTGEGSQPGPARPSSGSQPSRRCCHSTNTAVASSRRPRSRRYPRLRSAASTMHSRRRSSSYERLRVVLEELVLHLCGFSPHLRLAG